MGEVAPPIDPSAVKGCVGPPRSMMPQSAGHQQSDFPHASAVSRKRLKRATACECIFYGLIFDMSLICRIDLYGVHKFGDWNIRSFERKQDSFQS